MAYNSSNGVWFEAIKDIKAGEELMALFDSLKGTVIVESYWAKVGERESKKMKEGGVGSSTGTAALQQDIVQKHLQIHQ